MRIGQVVGKLSLSRVHPSLSGQRWVIVRPFDLEELKFHTGPFVGPDYRRKNPVLEELVVLDELGASPGGRIAFSEGGEAAAPFHPEKKPVDAYVACLIDQLTMDPKAAAALSAAGA